MSTTTLPTDLADALTGLAASPRVLLAVDFDGTLAPLVDDPLQARALPGGLAALRAAAQAPGVGVAVVSGRDLDTLRRLTGIAADEPITLIGSHGAQTSLASGLDRELLDEDQARTLGALTADLEQIVGAHPGARVEHKPASVVLHTRGIDPGTAAAATEAAHALPERYDGVHVQLGKDVVELSVVETSKGAALLTLATSLQVDAVAYLGDDVTDERAFEALDAVGRDVTVKVGPGETVAQHRVDGPEDVVAALELFVAARARA